jgi:hypothetical protein
VSRPGAAQLEELSKSPLWTNGLSPKLDLPKTATADELLAKIFRVVSFDRGKVTKHRILEQRTLKIGGETEPYAAYRVDTDQGQKIVLMRYEGPAVGWWSRIFDA